jgi:hypothetical protein
MTASTKKRRSDACFASSFLRRSFPVLEQGADDDRGLRVRDSDILAGDDAQAFSNVFAEVVAIEFGGSEEGVAFEAAPDAAPTEAAAVPPGSRRSAHDAAHRISHRGQGSLPEAKCDSATSAGARALDFRGRIGGEMRRQNVGALSRS